MSEATAPTTYRVQVQCDNCEFDGQAEVERGRTVPKVLECPRCGCMTAHKPTKPLVVPAVHPRKRPWDPTPDWHTLEVVVVNPPAVPKPVPKPFAPYEGDIPRRRRGTWWGDDRYFDRDPRHLCLLG